MKDPVTTPSGFQFERSALLKWMRNHGEECPITGEPLCPSELQVNTLLQWEILFWERKNEDAREVSRHNADTLPAMPQDRKLDKPPTMPHPSAEGMLRKKIDSPPSVPKRKGSSLDIFALCQRETAKEKLCTSTSREQQLVRSAMLTDVLRTLSINPMPVEKEFNAPDAQSILSVLDEVESMLGLGAF
jgi:hypothetical protein